MVCATISYTRGIFSCISKTKWNNSTPVGVIPKRTSGFFRPTHYKNKNHPPGGYPNVFYRRRRPPKAIPPRPIGGEFSPVANPHLKGIARKSAPIAFPRHCAQGR